MFIRSPAGNTRAKYTCITAGVELPAAWSLGISTLLGYGCARLNDAFYGHAKAGFVVLTLGVSTTLNTASGWQVKPALWFSPNRQNVWFSVELCPAR